VCAVIELDDDEDNDRITVRSDEELKLMLFSVSWISYYQSCKHLLSNVLFMSLRYSHTSCLWLSNTSSLCCVHCSVFDC